MRAVIVVKVSAMLHLMEMHSPVVLSMVFYLI